MVDGHAPLRQGADDADVGVGPGAAAGENEADGPPGQPADQAREVPGIALPQVGQAHRPSGRHPGLAAARAADARRLHKDKLSPHAQGGRGVGRHAGRRWIIAPAHPEQPVHLAGDLGGPGGLAMAGDIEGVVDGMLQVGKPGGFLPLRFRARDRDRKAGGPDPLRQGLDQGPDILDGPLSHEAEDRGLYKGRGAARIAGAAHHQSGQVGHDVRVGLARREEGLAVQRQDLGVPQGCQAAGMDRAGDQAHLPRRLARAHHAQEAGLVAPFDPEGAQPPGPEQVQLGRRLARPEQVQADGQAPPPSGPGQAGGLEKPGEGGLGRGLHAP